MGSFWTPKMTPFWDPLFTGLGLKNGGKWPKTGQKRGSKSDPKRDPHFGPLTVALTMFDGRARVRARPAITVRIQKRHF